MSERKAVQNRISNVKPCSLKSTRHVSDKTQLGCVTCSKAVDLTVVKKRYGHGKYAVICVGRKQKIQSKENNQMMIYYKLYVDVSPYISCSNLHAVNCTTRANRMSHLVGFQSGVLHLLESSYRHFENFAKILGLWVAYKVLFIYLFI